MNTIISPLQNSIWLTLFSSTRYLNNNKIKWKKGSTNSIKMVYPNILLHSNMKIIMQIVLVAPFALRFQGRKETLYLFVIFIFLFINNDSSHNLWTFQCNYSALSLFHVAKSTKHRNINKNTEMKRKKIPRIEAQLFQKFGKKWNSFFCH